MDNQTVAENYLRAFQTQDWDLLASVMTDNFVFSGPVPEPQNAQQYLGLTRTMDAAFSDLDYGVELLSVEGNVATAAFQLSGTHDGELDGRNMGLGVIPPTGNRFAAARQVGELTIEGGKVSEANFPPTEGAGLMAILGQLGIPVRG
jgi:predicted ester cyclase